MRAAADEGGADEVIDHRDKHERPDQESDGRRGRACEEQIEDGRDEDDRGSQNRHKAGDRREGGPDERTRDMEDRHADARDDALDDRDQQDTKHHAADRVHDALKEHLVRLVGERGEGEGFIVEMFTVGQQIVQTHEEDERVEDELGRGGEHVADVLERPGGDGLADRGKVDGGEFVLHGCGERLDERRGRGLELVQPGGVRCCRAD